MTDGQEDDLKMLGTMEVGFDEILTPEATGFIAALAREFTPQVAELMQRRGQRQARIDAGERPDFLAETKHIRESDWTVCAVPADLDDRRVEITGPTERKMVINALNSGAKVFMADCEDSMTPTWRNVIHGQINLRDAVNRSIELTSGGKQYRLNDDTATLIVRPRGWHLPEKHLLVDGKAVPGALVDFGLYLFHNAAELKKRGSGPYFYLPKLQSHLEARLWSDVFKFAEKRGVVGEGEIKVTVLIETILAAFEMDEILYELKDHIVGQNCGRWDYIFSFIKTFNKYPEFTLPDRSEVTMTSHFLRSYSQLVIKTCHRRKAYAIGGMAAQIPIKNDAAANDAAMAKVRADKEREVHDGHDGTWVAHPGLVPLAMEIFDAHMAGPNQLDRLRDDVQVCAEDILQVVKGKITETGLRNNINIGVQYLAAWLDGNGCVPLNNLMEDAATAEISRAQVWQWVHHETGVLDDGRNITYAWFKALLREEMDCIREQVGDEAFENGRFRKAAKLMDEITGQDEFVPFLTSVAYEYID
ncbi:MAG: malate synthase A [Gammaproteobacteria bacterium]|nr:malate synthase A [Gammaproteobacteria bacterium]